MEEICPRGSKLNQLKTTKKNKLKLVTCWLVWFYPIRIVLWPRGKIELFRIMWWLKLRSREVKWGHVARLRKAGTWKKRHNTGGKGWRQFWNRFSCDVTQSTRHDVIEYYNDDVIRMWNVIPQFVFCKLKSDRVLEMTSYDLDHDLWPWVIRGQVQGQMRSLTTNIYN